MPGELHDFGLVRSIDAEAIGAPGQRRFRLAIQSDAGSVSLWLEKEQLAALSTATEQQLVRTRRREPSGGDDEETPPFPLNPSLDFQAGQLALGYDDVRHLFVIQAYETGTSAEGQATFGCLASRGQARRLVKQVGRLMVSGRPVCPLCGAPMQAEHVCPRTNGHAEVTLS